MSVKSLLRPIDDSKGSFSRIAEHPVLVRDPVDRFVSSVFQRMREFKGYAQSAITPAAFAAEARTVTRHLASNRGRLTLEYVHFQRQSEFVLEDGEQVVSRIFRLDQLDLAAEFIAECTGVHIETDDRLNRSTELRSGRLQPVVRVLRIPYARLIPLGIRQQIRSAMHQSGLYGEVDKDRFVRPNGELSTFLKDYYRDDFVLFAEAWRPAHGVVASHQDGLCAV
ncbi:MAG: hypothetical protein B7Z08_06220 [Sphingomonadales bacterium 32-68-7]|nr:MAG: hypothetical protein B7Z08_06220 [Sphingomonadales bacterium 32-68-7]